MNQTVPTERNAAKRRKSPAVSAVTLALASLLAAPPALLVSVERAAALSEIKREEPPPEDSAQAPNQAAPNRSAPAQPSPDQPAAPDQPAVEVPLPDPINRIPAPDEDAEPEPDVPQDAAPGDNADPDDADPDSGTPPSSQVTPDNADPRGELARPDVDPDAPLPAVEYDMEKLPEPVRRMRSLLLEACQSGDIEKLRPLIGTGKSAPLLSLTDDVPDPLSFLKSEAGDPDGREMLAIMEEVLNAGYVHLNAGKPEELYVWPYFFGLPLDKLTPRQTVELFKILTAGDYEEMKTYGSYIFYRLGITPNGEWAFFVAGE